MLSALGLLKINNTHIVINGVTDPNQHCDNGYLTRAAMHESMIDHGFSLLAYKSVLIFSLDSSLVPRLLGFLPTTDRQHCRRECIPGAEDAITRLYMLLRARKIH